MHPTVLTFKSSDGTNSTGDLPGNPFATPWGAVLSAYYWDKINFDVWNYWPLKVLALISHITLVLVLLNMIIALMK